MNIPRGTPILSEQVFLSVSNGTNVRRAPTEDARFTALGGPAGMTRQQRFDANSFEMENNRRGIFLEASRFNHSCRPNAFFAWNGKSNRLTVHAIVDIPEDTELFINYHARDYLETTLDRQQELRGTYGFTCTCAACNSRTRFGIASQNRRAQMRILEQNIDRDQKPNRPHLNQNHPQKRNQVLANLRNFSLLLEWEGLFYPQLADVYGKAITWYRIEMDLADNGVASARYQSGRPKESLRGAALKVARRKLDYDVACNGHDSPVVLEMLKLIEELKVE